MKIIHRVSLASEHRATRKIEKLGIKTTDAGLIRYFEIEEGNAIWPEIRQLVAKHNLPDITRTIFTAREIRSAEWVAILPHAIIGYPMPDEDAGYKKVSFASDKECSECGMGRQQTAPINLAGEPAIGQNHFMAVNWTFDLFAKENVFSELGKRGITGFVAEPALDFATGKELKTVRQLQIPNAATSGLQTDNLQKEVASCGHTRYTPFTQGQLVTSATALGATDLVRSQEWFGSGHAANQVILASHRFVEAYVENKWKGLLLMPLEVREHP